MMNDLFKFSVCVLWITVIMCLSANLYAGVHPDIRIRISQNDTAAGETVFQGGPTSVDIVFDGGVARIGGFDFLLQYDASRLSLTSVNEGNIYPNKGWEFFTFRFGPNGNCGAGCPSPRKVRIVGLADVKDGAPGGDVNLGNGDTFAELNFLVSNDRALGCEFVPIRFSWLDCGHNSISSGSSDTFLISSNVFDFRGSDTDAADTDFRRELTGQDSSFPTITGATPECDSVRHREVFERRVGFYNGGIQLTCPGEIDDRGDYNLNGIPYEIEDFEILLEYFLSGVSDSIPLSVADVVYFIRNIFDEAVPLSELTHDKDTVTFKQSDGAVFSDLVLGAAFFVFEGNPDVQLLDPTMEMLTGSSGGRKRVLIISIGSDQLAPGRILLTVGKILLAQASDFNGSRVVVEFDFATDVTDDESALLPDEFQLQQNYPNPFNPTTTIEFALPERGAVELIIYNTLGRKVRSLASGMYSAGSYTVSWDGTDNYGRQVTSGVYYYRLRAGDVVQSRKMLLLK